MSEFDKVDIFTDAALVDDPFPYFEHLRSQCPVHPLPQRNVMAVTGFDEALKVYNNPKAFSSVIGVGGPIPPLPFKPEGDDISAQLEAFRGEMPLTEQIVTMDDERHSHIRSLLTRLFLPSRLRESEDFIRRVADEQIDRLINKGNCEFFSDYGHPFAMLVIADLLGVPDEDMELFRKQLAVTRVVSSVEGDVHNSDFFQFIGQYFYRYVEDRRRDPRDDILSELATAALPDGTTPSINDVVNVASFLFAAGLDTTAKLLATSLRILSENPELQEKLRNDRTLIPDFIEEVLRYDGPVKSSFRLARKRATIGPVDIPAGTCVMLVNLAMNRDPSRYEKPDEFHIGRPRNREHLAFGRGAHTCPGAPLARTEARISLERILERLADIRISDTKHGPRGARKFKYEPTYILRGLSRLHLEFTPNGSAQ
jgi:cytochrome P450